MSFLCQFRSPHGAPDIAFSFHANLGIRPDAPRVDHEGFQTGLSGKEAVLTGQARFLGEAKRGVQELLVVLAFGPSTI